MEPMIKMAAPTAALLPGGALRDLALTIEALGIGKDTDTDFNRGITSSEIPVSAVSLDNVLAVVRAGGSVAAWPCWLLMAAEDLDNPVIEGLPNRVDGDGQILTWRSWHDDLHDGPRLSLDGTLALVATNGFGTDLEGSEILALSEAGHTIKSQEETQALQADPAWTTPGV